jgi:hypothetical protein
MTLVPSLSTYTIGVDTNVTFSANLIDLESGVVYAYFSLASPLIPLGFIYESVLTLVSGDKYNGTWEKVITFEDLDLHPGHLTMINFAVYNDADFWTASNAVGSLYVQPGIKKIYHT